MWVGDNRVVLKLRAEREELRSVNKTRAYVVTVEVWVRVWVAGQRRGRKGGKEMGLTSLAGGKKERNREKGRGREETRERSSFSKFHSSSIISKTSTQSCLI